MKHANQIFSFSDFLEDAHVIYAQDTWGFFGVFDGHGGEFNMIPCFLACGLTFMTVLQNVQISDIQNAWNASERREWHEKHENNLLACTCYCACCVSVSFQIHSVVTVSCLNWGDQCSGFIARRIHEELAQSGMPDDDEAVIALALRLDKEFLDSNQPSGSTGTFVIVKAPTTPGGNLALSCFI